jgi:NAD-dependent protein deacetylase/lipoamidase
VVYPAASMPLIAKQAGAKLVIINYTPTDMDGQADVVIHEKAGIVMQSLLERVRGKL